MRAVLEVLSFQNRGGALFDYYKAIGHIQTSYTVMFSFRAVAYIIAWEVTKLLVMRMEKVEI